MLSAAQVDHGSPSTATTRAERGSLWPSPDALVDTTTARDIAQSTSIHGDTNTPLTPPGCVEDVNGGG